MADTVNGGAVGAESGKKGMNDADKILCNRCNELITKGAPVCYHCGRDQTRLMRCLAPASLIVAVGLLLLSVLQFFEATRQRQSADAALSRAEATERRVTQIAITTVPIFESLLEATGTYGGYSSKEIEKLTRPLKEAIAENAESRAKH